MGNALSFMALGTQVSRTRFLAFPKLFFWVTRNPGTRNLKIFGDKFWVARSLENFWIPDSGIQIPGSKKKLEEG